MKTKKLDLASHYPVLQAFRNSKAQVRCIMGAIGSGKSRACCQELISIILRQKKDSKGWRTAQLAFVKHSQKSIYSTMLDSWNEFLEDSRLTKWNGKLGCYVFSIPQLKIGAKIYFIGLDRINDDDNLKGLRLTCAWINEAFYINNWRLVQILIGRLGRYPTDNKKGYLIIDTNPPNIDHWVYTELYQSTSDEKALFKQPDGMSDEAENRHNLAKLYGSHYNYYEMKMAMYNIYQIKTDIHGEFGIQMNGKPIYPSFHTDIHVLKKHFYNDFNKKSLRETYRISQPIIIGVDTQLNASATYMFLDDLTGKWIVFDEIVPRDDSWSCERLAYAMLEKQNNLENWYNFEKFEYYVDPEGNSRTGVDGNTTIKLFKSDRFKLNAKEANSNNSISLRRLTTTHMIDHKKLLVMNNCRILIEGLSGGYHRKQVNNVGEVRYHSKAADNKYQHLCEALEYAFLGFKTYRDTVFKRNTRRDYTEWDKFTNDLGFTGRY